MAVTNLKNVSKPNHLKLSIITNGNSNNEGNSNIVDIYHPSCMKNSVATHFLSLVAFGPKKLTQLPGEL